MPERLDRHTLEIIALDSVEEGADYTKCWIAAELLEARELIETLCKCATWNYYNGPRRELMLISGPSTAAGMHYLASIGRLEIESDDGVRVLGRLKP